METWSVSKFKEIFRMMQYDEYVHTIHEDWKQLKIRYIFNENVSVENADGEIANFTFHEIKEDA